MTVSHRTNGGASPPTLPDPQEQDTPMFFPPLWMQRRTFVLDWLRKENIRSVVELGCGEGNVLRVLCQPAFHADEFPPSVIPPSESWQTKREREAYDKLRQLKPAPLHQQELHLRKLAGLDICCDLLQTAQQATVQSVHANVDKEDEDLWDDLSSEDHIRWEPLRVDLWEGSLSVYNDTFEGYEAFIATEVIEHLDEETLDQFGNAILDKYNPRLVIITTPPPSGDADLAEAQLQNYDFNQYFDNDGDAEEGKRRIADPTKRTSRYFRDNDHKFEWTQAEFKAWVTELANDYNYDFTITGVGNLKHFRKVDNPPEALYATQCAVLRRRDNGEVELRQSRSPMTTPLPFFSTLPDGDALPPTSPTRRPHILRSTQQHLVHPGAGHAASNKSIRKALAETMTFMNTTRDSLRSLWIRERVSKRCGGYVMKLLEAIIDDKTGAWSFEVVDTAHYRGLDNVEVHWNNKTEAKDMLTGPFNDLSVGDGTETSVKSEVDEAPPSELPDLFPELQQPVHAPVVPNPWVEAEEAAKLAPHGNGFGEGHSTDSGWSGETNGW